MERPPSLTAQTEAVHIAIQRLRPGARKLSRSEIELLEARLQAVLRTLRAEVDRLASYNVEPQPFLED